MFGALACVSWRIRFEFFAEEKVVTNSVALIVEAVTHHLYERYNPEDSSPTSFRSALSEVLTTALAHNQVITFLAGIGNGVFDETLLAAVRKAHLGGIPRVPDWEFRVSADKAEFRTTPGSGDWQTLTTPSAIQEAPVDLVAQEAASRKHQFVRDAASHIDQELLSWGLLSKMPVTDRHALTTALAERVYENCVVEQS